MRRTAPTDTELAKVQCGTIRGGYRSGDGRREKAVDAWALLAWLRDEQPAADSVRNALRRAPHHSALRNCCAAISNGSQTVENGGE